MKNKDKKIVIFDLDETVIDSSHRTPNNPDGTLNLNKYFELKNRENIFKDSLLPLAAKMKELYASGEYHVVICTARHMDENDFDFLEHHGLKLIIIIYLMQSIRLRCSRSIRTLPIHSSMMLGLLWIHSQHIQMCTW